MGMLLGSIALILVGGGMLEMCFFSKDPEFGIASRIAMFVFGLLFLIPGIILLKLAISELKQSSEKKGKLKDNVILIGQDIKNGLTGFFLNNYGAESDKNLVERLISAFRSNLSLFFKYNTGFENEPIQENVTQIYRNILDFRRNRLKRMGVAFNLDSIRKNYGGRAVYSKTYFDGKYQITDVKENIAARSVFSKNGKCIYNRVDKDIACYTLINAKSSGTNKIICPNCGSMTTRENLLDGCDFCRTKFMVEDLGIKVSDFALRKDYDVEYVKYKDFRHKMIVLSSIIWGLICLIFCSYWAFRVSGDVVSETGSGPIMTFMATLFTALFPAAAFTFIGVFFFIVCIFPFIQFGASANYTSKKILDKIKAASRDDKNTENIVKKFDNLFSINGFYSNVQNKIAAVHYADTKEQINAFSYKDISGLLNNYTNVIDMDMDYITLRNYRLDQGLQIADVEAGLNLISYNGKKCSRKSEKLNLTLTKSAACKTQVVCAPSVMRCKCCGSPISLLDGRICHQCGTDIGLEQYDWVIREYNVG